MKKPPKEGYTILKEKVEGDGRNVTSPDDNSLSNPSDLSIEDCTDTTKIQIKDYKKIISGISKSNNDKGELTKPSDNGKGMNTLDVFQRIQKDIDNVEQPAIQLEPNQPINKDEGLDQAKPQNVNNVPVIIEAATEPSNDTSSQNKNKQEPIKKHAEKTIQIKTPSENKKTVSQKEKPLRHTTKAETKNSVKTFDKKQSQNSGQDDRDPKAAEEPQKSKFMELCTKGEWGVVEQLLRSYSNDNTRPHMADLETGETPLMLACKENRLVIVEKLMEFNVNVNEKAADGSTALHYAAKFSKEDIVKLLLSKNADPDAFGSVKKNLPIHMACGRGLSSPTVVSCILKATKEGRLQMDKEGAIPLVYAIESGSIMTIKELLEKDAIAQMEMKLKHNGDAPIHIACRKKDLEALRLLCEAQCYVDLQNASGQTALHIAAEEGDENILKYLYTMKANANLLDDMDRSALYMAAEKGYTKTVDYLIDKFKCNVLTRDKEGNTLMHITALSGHQETTISFLKRGVPLHMPNKAGAVCLHAAAQRGHANVVRALLEKNANVNARTKDMYTPIHIAVKYGNPAVVETLIGHGAQVNVKGGLLDESPLHIAAQLKGGERCAEMLLKSGANVNETMKNGETSLHISARTGNLEMLKSILNEGANLALTCLQGNTALHIGVRYCHFDIVQELISFINRTKSKIDVTLFVNMANNEGETALHLAAEIEKKRAHSDFEDTDIMKILLEYDGDMGIQTKFTLETPLHFCATAGNSDVLLEIVNYLDHKIQQAVNKQAKNGWSPLLYASNHGHDNIVSILLKCNARVDVFDEHGMTALHLASEKGHSKVAEVLLQNKAFVNAKSKGGLTPLHLAAQNGFKELVVILVKTYNAAIDAVTLNRKTPLHLAAQHGQKGVCEALLFDKNNPANPNAVDAKGHTPMHLAARNDHSAVVRLFLRCKPELMTDAKIDNDGMTSAHIAAANGSLSVIKELMKFNKTVIHGTKNKSTGSTPLHLAAEGGHTKVVKVLVDAGASLIEENNEGMTCFLLAAKYGHIELIESLKSKIDPKKVSKKTGMTPLHVASHCGQIEVVRELLVDVPANIPSKRPDTGDEKKDSLTECCFTPLHLAAQSGHENIVRLLLNCDGVEVTAVTKINGSIPLHFAAENGHTNVTSLLLSKSASQISKKDKKGRTALHLAASHGHLEMATLLIGQGADINSNDNNDFTPLHFAAKSGYLKVAKFLVASGAISDKETNDFKIPLIFAAHFNHTDVMSFLLRQKHSTERLMEDSKFLYDLMICSKLNNFKSMEEFILLSESPAETAAKLSQCFRSLSESEKERSKDLLIVADYCENMCTDLVALAAVDKGADKLLRSIDNRGVQFLDILIDTQQKEVISHASVQKYLSDVWIGGVNWPAWKLLIIFAFFLIFPISWLFALLPWGKRFFNSPMVKFFIYLISHLYLTGMLMYIAIWDTYPYLRTTSLPTIQEWVLLVCLSGQLVSELINPADRKGIAVLKIITLILAAIAIFVHISSLVVVTPPLPELIYIRNQIFAFSTFTSLIVILDFLAIHNLFGPWTIIIRKLTSDLFRFTVILLLFMIGFSCICTATFQPINPLQNGDIVFNMSNEFVFLYFSLYGQLNSGDLPNPAYSTSYAPTLTKIVFGIFMLLDMVVLINLLIAMLTDTYETIHEQSDVEWKFGRSKLIRNMKKTTPIPSPFILLSQAMYYVQVAYFSARHLPIPLNVEDDFDDIANESGNGAMFRRKSQLQPEEINLKHKSPEKIEDVVDWTSIVRRYLVIRNGEGGMLSLDDFPDDDVDKKEPE